MLRRSERRQMATLSKDESALSLHDSILGKQDSTQEIVEASSSKDATDIETQSILCTSGKDTQSSGNYISVYLTFSTFM